MKMFATKDGAESLITMSSVIVVTSIKENIVNTQVLIGLVSNTSRTGCSKHNQR